MTYDLGAFGKQNSRDSIASLYIKACESKIVDIKPSPEMVKFIEEMSRLYPDLDSVPESEIDNCPWACGFDQSDRHWIAPMLFSFVENMVPKVIELARKCNVYIYDPQSDKIIG